MESIMQAIRAVRNRRAEMNVPPARRTTLYIVTEKQDLFSAGIPFITRLAYASRVVEMPVASLSTQFAKSLDFAPILRRYKKQLRYRSLTCSVAVFVFVSP